MRIAIVPKEWTFENLDLALYYRSISYYRIYRETMQMMRLWLNFEIRTGRFVSYDRFRWECIEITNVLIGQVCLKIFSFVKITDFFSRHTYEQTNCLNLKWRKRFHVEIRFYIFNTWSICFPYAWNSLKMFFPKLSRIGDFDFNRIKSVELVSSSIRSIKIRGSISSDWNSSVRI